MQPSAALAIHPLSPPYYDTLLDEHQGRQSKRRCTQANRIDDVFADIEQEIDDAKLLFSEALEHQDPFPSIVDDAWLESSLGDVERYTTEISEEESGGSKNNYEDQALSSILAVDKYDDIGEAAIEHNQFEDSESPDDEVCFGMVGS